MFDPVLQALPAFATYFAVAAAILGAFIAVYALLTPYSELALIRAGNTAAAISLGGALIGMALPVATAVFASHNLYIMLGWGVVACIVQLAAFVVARLALPHLCTDIPADKPAAGIFLATLAIAIGILNAACIL